MNRLGEISTLYEIQPQPVAATSVKVEEIEEEQAELDIDKELDAIDLDSSE